MLLNFVSAARADGGTGIANVLPDQIPIYEEAIRRYGASGYALSMHPMRGTGLDGYVNLASLHYLGDRAVSDFSPFWRVYHLVRMEEEKKRAPIPLMLTRVQAEVLMTACRRIGGHPTGPRGRIDEILDALERAGIERTDHAPYQGTVYLGD